MRYYGSKFWINIEIIFNGGISESQKIGAILPSLSASFFPHYWIFLPTYKLMLGFFPILKKNLTPSSSFSYYPMSFIYSQYLWSMLLPVLSEFSSYNPCHFTRIALRNDYHAANQMIISVFLLFDQAMVFNTPCLAF